MNTLGTTTKTLFLKQVSGHKIHEEFVTIGLRHKLTFSAALVAANVINGTVGTTAIAPITYASTSDSTMAAIAAAIAATPGVKSASVVQLTTGTADDRVIIVVPIDQVSGIPLTGFVVTLGASQATIAVTVEDFSVKKGMPVEIEPSTGNIRPLSGLASLTYIGIAMHDADYNGFCTVATRGLCIVNALAKAALNAGPVNWDSFDKTLGMNMYNQTAVDTTTYQGWALEVATAVNEEIRVLVRD